MDMSLYIYSVYLFTNISSKLESLNNLTLSHGINSHFADTPYHMIFMFLLSSSYFHVHDVASQAAIVDISHIGRFQTAKLKVI